jgi:hypothetical protein
MVRKVSIKVALRDYLFPSFHVGDWYAVRPLVAPVLSFLCRVRMLLVEWSFAQDIAGFGDVGKPIRGRFEVLSDIHLLQLAIARDSIDDERCLPIHVSILLAEKKKSAHTFFIG